MSEFDPRPTGITSHPVPAVPTQNVPAAAAPMPPFAAPWDAEPKQSGFNFLAFLHSFRRRWLLGVGLGCLIASTVAALLWATVPIKSEAVMQLRVYRNNDEMLSSHYKPQAHPQDFEINKQTQMAMLTSPFVASAALRAPGIGQLPLVRYKPWFGKRENPVAWLEKQLKVQSADGSELIQISMKAPYAQRDQLIKLLDSIKVAYLREVVDEDKNDDRRKLEKLKDRQRDLGRDVRSQMEQIAELTKTYGSMQSDSVQVQLELHYRNLAALERERSGLDLKYNETFDAALMHQTRMRSVTSYKPLPWEIEDMLLQYPEYAALKTQEIEMSSAMQSMGGRGGAMGGGAQMQGQLQRIQQQMQQFQYEHQEEAEARIRSIRNMDSRVLEEDSKMLQTQMQSLAQRRNDIAQQVAALQERIKKMGEFNGDLAVRQLDLQSDQEMLARIDQEIQTLQLDMSRRPKIEPLMEKPLIPDTGGNWIVKYMQVIASWLLTFMGTVLGIALWDMQHQRVNNSQEVIDIGDVRVIGTLPALNSRRVGGLLPTSGGQRRLVEMTLMRTIDSIRTALLFARSDRPYEVIMVTSALGNEGKTTVASQLAVSFARSGRRTLLVDGDIRNPQQHIVLGMPMEKGLSEVLRSECTVDDVLQATSAEGLWSLSAGHRDAYTDQVMASSVVSKLFQELRSRFDMIVIDTGPALTSPDAMLLGQHADTTVLSVRRDVSRLPKVNEAVDRLRGVGLSVAGVVLNGAGVDVRESEGKQLPTPKANEPQLEQAAAPVAAATQAAADTADDVFEAAPGVFDADTEVETEPGSDNDENV